MAKKHLLSIGEISKITGASVKSLRYYERIGILTPAYTDPCTKYRYYSAPQIYTIDLIQHFIELDIPLKDMSGFTNADNINFRNLLEHGEKIAKQKLKSVKKGLALIKEAKHRLDLAELHQDGEIYTRVIPEKYFYALPCNNPLENESWLEVALSFFEKIPADEYADDEMPAVGFLCEHLSKGMQYYIFVEAPKGTGPEDEDVKVIPAGEYWCRQNTRHRLDNVREVFKEQLGDAAGFLAIEVEVFLGRFKIDQPPTELRVIVI